MNQLAKSHPLDTIIHVLLMLKLHLNPALITLPGWHSGKESVCQYRRCKRCGFDSWVGKMPWRRKWQPTPVFLPGKCHGQRSLVGPQSIGSWRVRDSRSTEYTQKLKPKLSFFVLEAHVFRQMCSHQYYRCILGGIWRQTLCLRKKKCHRDPSLASLVSA